MAAIVSFKYSRTQFLDDLGPLSRHILNVMEFKLLSSVRHAMDHRFLMVVLGRDLNL